MTEKFHHNLKDFLKSVMQMGQFATDMLTNSVIALKEQNLELAERVHDQKDILAEMDEKIEQHALKLLTLYQPMAIDIRTIGASLKTITYITRIGRYGKDIAKATLDLGKESHIAKVVTIPIMEKEVNQMIQDALNAYDSGDLSNIDPGSFSERDDSIDAQRYSIFRECLTYMMEDPKNITRCANYIMIARYLERCGDHACKIAEKVHYMVTGKRVEIN